MTDQSYPAASCYPIVVILADGDHLVWLSSFEAHRHRQSRSLRQKHACVLAVDAFCQIGGPSIVIIHVRQHFSTSLILRPSHYIMCLSSVAQESITLQRYREVKSSATGICRLRDRIAGRRLRDLRPNSKL
jgi:hypothetical protein